MTGAAEPVAASSTITVVASEDHRRHAPEEEANAGVAVGMYERPSRADEIAAALERDDRFRSVTPSSHGTAPITAVHDPGLLAYLETAWQRFHGELPERAAAIADSFLHPAMVEGMGPGREPSHSGAGAVGYWCFDTATPVVEGSYAAARAAVDIALSATTRVLDGERLVYGLCRPPGHHAARRAFGGYCYFNNAGVAAEHVVRTTGAKVTVLDVDYHHGNGTQQLFYDRADVQYVSLHADPARAYPFFTGYADETGSGTGRGTTLNVPLAPRTDDAGFADALERALDAVEAFGPSLVIVSLGVDTYELDPIGDLAVTTEGMRGHGAQVARRGLPLVVLQEGGYHIGHIGRNVHAWLTGAAAALPA